MLLVIDVGNTNTVLGAFDGARVAHTWRISTVVRTTDEVAILLHQLFTLARLGTDRIGGIAICTVVPATLFHLEKACRRVFGHTPRVIGRDEDFGMEVRIDNPSEVGPDRIVNAVAARMRHAPPFLVVDFGTATTFDAVDATGAYVGGAIAPGLQISAEALFTRTSRLPRVEIAQPPKAVGSNTVAAMQSGLFWGYVGLVDGIARRCKAELGGEVPCIATGGLANLVGRACEEIDEVDEYLTLHGLRIWFERG